MLMLNWLIFNCTQSYFKPILQCTIKDCCGSNVVGFSFTEKELVSKLCGFHHLIYMNHSQK